MFIRNFRLDEIPALKNPRGITTDKSADGIRERLLVTWRCVSILDNYFAL